MQSCPPRGPTSPRYFSPRAVLSARRSSMRRGPGGDRCRRSAMRCNNCFPARRHPPVEYRPLPPQVASRVAVHRAAACQNICRCAPIGLPGSLNSPAVPVVGENPTPRYASPPEPPMARGPQRGRRRDAHPTAGVHQPPHGAGRAQGDLGDAFHDPRKVFGRQTPPYHNLFGPRAHDGRRGDPPRALRACAPRCFRRG